MEFEVWRDIFEGYGLLLELKDWSACIGTVGGSFDIYRHLGDLSGRELDRESLRTLFHSRYAEGMDGLHAMPGVVEWLQEAESSGMRLGIASCSGRVKIEAQLERLGLRRYFDAIASLDDIARPKPEPDAYLAACKLLDVRPDRAVAVEDSPNGCKSALSAGVACIAVPQGLTRDLVFPQAHLILGSMAEMGLHQALENVSRAMVIEGGIGS